MIRISSISVPLSTDLNDLRAICTGKLGIPGKSLHSVRLSRKAVDARKRSDIHFTISLDVEADGEGKLLKRLRNAAHLDRAEYRPPVLTKKPKHRPVVVGFGPAGMFAALALAESGAEPIVLERGYDADKRAAVVELYRSTGRLDPECNVQFGEGGAGTFSDGKLTTGIRDERIGYVLRRLAEFGAPEEITFLAKPHIGTDRLRECVKALRRRVTAMGGEVRFGARFTGFSAENGRISAVEYVQENKIYSLRTDSVILAAGHSAGDVFELLHSEGISMTQKSFSVGVRIEHLREDIDRAMYGDMAGHPALRAADYKLAVHLPNGRSLYTFCMCPGGEVIAASSDEGRICTNGMSLYARDGVNSNSALLVGVGPSDYGSSHPLAGLYFQKRLEAAAFTAGGWDHFAPAAAVGSFMSGRLCGFGRVAPSYRPGVREVLPQAYLPDYVCETLRLGLPEMGRRIQGFDDADAVLTGIESRSSSPVRIERDDSLQSQSLRGLYPCGEGAGHAGGIVSAAVDGIKCSEAIINDLM